MSGPDLPLRALAAFEAAARLQSFRAAAEELHLTPSAVSHQIRALEQRLGLRLFERVGRGIVLSQEGSDYYRAIGDSFRRLREATAAAARRGRPGQKEIVRIQTPPSLAGQWLLPRLPAFLARHPGIDIRLSAEMGRSARQPDLTIHYGSAADWSGRALPLLEERLQPYCTPSLLAAGPPAGARDLLAFTLIRTRGNLLSWEDWFRAQGLEQAVAAARSIQFDPSHVAIDAAVKGLGLVLESNLLTESEVAAEALVAILPDTVLSLCSYWLAGAAAGPPRPAVATVRDWLLAIAGSG